MQAYSQPIQIMNTPPLSPPQSTHIDTATGHIIKWMLDKELHSIATKNYIVYTLAINLASRLEMD